MYSSRSIFKVNFSRSVAILAFFLLNLVAIARVNDSLRLINNLWLGAALHYGTVLPHHASIEYALKNNITAFEIALSTDTYGRTTWDKLYRYPRIGAGYLVTTLGNRKVFGTANAVFLFMDFPFTSKPKKFLTGYQINFGISYVSKLYHVYDNPLNMAMSTGLNVYASIRFNAKYLIDQKNELSACFGLSHFSNGKVASPNLGINTGCLMLGYRYRILAPRYQKLTDNKMNFSNKHSGEVVISTGTKNDDQITGKTYLIASLTCDYKYIFSRKYAFGAGTDFFYDQAIGPNMIYELGGSYSTRDLIQAGIHGALYARYSKLTVVGNIGTYLYAKYCKYTRVYTRIGFRYEVHRHILLNLSLKAHYAIADYIEWGLGYRF